MIAPCQLPGEGAGAVRGLLAFVDCHAVSIGEGGYRALAAPGSSLSVTLTALFTILIALIGYRMMLGETPRLRDGVLTFVKIGVVLALATGWSGYRTLFFDVALRGPAALAAEIGAPLQLPGADGGLADRLQSVDDGFDALMTIDAERAAASARQAFAQPSTPIPGMIVAGAPAAGAVPAGPPPPQADVVSLRSARQFVLVAALGSLAATHLLAGVLLAIGPFFIAFLLFDGTRGLFVGWLRMLGGAALGAFGASLIAGVGVSYFAPTLTELVARRAAGTPIVAGESMLLPASLIFALVTLAVLIGLARVAAGLRWPDRGGAIVVERASDRRASEPPLSLGAGPGLSAAASARARSLVVADAVSGQVRREQAADAARDAPAPRAGPMTRSAPDAALSPPPLGQTFRRQARGRVSAGMNRRNAS